MCYRQTDRSMLFMVALWIISLKVILWVLFKVVLQILFTVVLWTLKVVLSIVLSCVVPLFVETDETLN